MKLHWNHIKHLSDPEVFEEEHDAIQEWEDEYGDHASKSEKQAMIRKKIEERLEQKRLRHELDDYDEEIHSDFDWGGH